MGAGASAEAPSFDDIDISKWSKEEVAQEVAGMGEAFEEYKQMVLDNDIDGKVLGSLTSDDLEGAGVDKSAHREEILARVTELNGARAPARSGTSAGFVPPKDLEANAPAQARLLALEAEVAAAPAAGELTPEQHAAIDDCFRTVRAVLDDAAAQADPEELKNVVMTEGVLHRDAYAA